jgi:hypothetical protein
MRRRRAVAGRRASLDLDVRPHGAQGAVRESGATMLQVGDWPAKDWQEPSGQKPATNARRVLAPHRPPPGRASLPLDAWLSGPPWLEVPAQAGHPDTSTGDAAMTDEAAGCGNEVKRAEPDGIFGLWLQRTLQSLFSAVAEESIPAELLRILEAAPEMDESGTKKQP